MGGKTTLAPLISDGARTEIAQSSLSRLVSERHRLPALLAFLAFLPLSVVPYLGKPAGNVSSAGTARGYNTALAYEFVLLVSMAIMGAFALREWRNPTPRAAQEPAVAPGHRPIARPKSSRLHCAGTSESLV